MDRTASPGYAFFFSVHGDNVDTAIPWLPDDACLPAEILPHIAYKTLERLGIHLLESLAQVFVSR